jgi:hypothetical protein
MVDAFIISSAELAKVFGERLPAGKVLVIIPSGILSFSEYLGLESLKTSRGADRYTGSP